MPKLIMNFYEIVYSKGDTDLVGIYNVFSNLKRQ